MHMDPLDWQYQPTAFVTLQPLTAVLQPAASTRRSTQGWVSSTGTNSAPVSW